MKKEKKVITADSISSMVRQFQSIRILLTAYELDVFSMIASAPKTSERIASKLNTDPRATDRLLNALTVLGFLNKRKNKFSNTRESATYLSRRSPGYMSGLMHQVHLWDRWTGLTESVRKGTSVIDQPENVNDRNENWIRSFIAAMHYRAKENAGKLISGISLKGVQTVLDVGGGSGVFSMAFVNSSRHITATVFDLPNVISETQKYIRKEKLTSRIKTFPGDYNTDPLPKGYDIVFLSAIIHSNSYRENQKLIRKCAAALNKGGRVIVKDQVMDESRTKPARGALFSLNMIVGTKGGDTYTGNEIREWFEKAGLHFEKRIARDSEDTMMIARKN